MKTSLSFIVISAFLLTAIGLVGHALGLTLADGGSTDYVIVVANDAIPAEVTAGDELKAYVDDVLVSCDSWLRDKAFTVTISSDFAGSEIRRVDLRAIRDPR